MTLTTLAALALLWLIAGVALAALMINGTRRLEDDQQARDVRQRTPIDPPAAFDWDDFDARR